LAGRMPLKIVYLLVRRVLGLAVLVFRTDPAKMPNYWYSGTRTLCCAATPAGYVTNQPTGPGSPRWPGSYRVTAGPKSSL
jgi:hypothetical protein